MTHNRLTQAELEHFACLIAGDAGMAPIINRFAEQWEHEPDGPRRYVKLVENSNLTAWLLGWRPGEETTDHHVDVTPIHGHADSTVVIRCLRGEVDHEGYGLHPQDKMVKGDVFPVTYERTVLAAGQNLYLPDYGIHTVACDEGEGRGFALTLHLYTPALRRMTYFEPWAFSDEDGSPTALQFTDTWDDPEVPAHEKMPFDIRYAQRVA